MNLENLENRRMKPMFLVSVGDETRAFLSHEKILKCLGFDLIQDSFLNGWCDARKEIIFFIFYYGMYVYIKYGN